MDNQFKFTEQQKEKITDIKDYIFRIMSNWKWFLVTVPIALIIAYYINISAQKIYGLTTTIAVKEKQNPLFASGTNIAFNWGGVSDKVESIRKTITSRSHNEKVVSELKFYIDYLQEGKFRVEDVYGKVPFKIELQPNQEQLLNTPIKVDFIDDESFNLSVEFDPEISYKLINYEQQTAKILTQNNTSISKKYAINEYINLPFFRAQIVKTASDESLKGKSYIIKLNTVTQTTNKYRSIRAKALQGTSLVELSLQGSNKNRLVDYLNKTVEVLAEDELEEKTNYARSTKQFIDAQFKNTADSLKLIEDNIGRFKQQNLIYDLSAQGTEIFSQTTGLDKIQTELTDRIAYFDNLENYIKTHTNYSKIPAPAIINIEKWKKKT